MKVNEYIRTPYHKIEKIIKIVKEDKWNMIYTNTNVYSENWLKATKTKHSFEIIDLIKVRRLCK